MYSVLWRPERLGREREREIPRSVGDFHCDLPVEGEVKWEMVKSGLPWRGFLIVVWAAQFRAPISWCCDLIFEETTKGRKNGWVGGREGGLNLPFSKSDPFPKIRTQRKGLVEFGEPSGCVCVKEEWFD